MNHYPDEKTSFLDEDIPVHKSPTWFGYRRRTILIFIAMALTLITFQFALIPLQKLYKCHSIHPRDFTAGSTEGEVAFSTATHSGQMTFYQPGLGSCGLHNTANDLICAISHGLYDSKKTPNPNNNPFCKKKIKACRGGKCVVVMAVDRCEGCAYWDLDMSPAAFKKLADPSLGRVDITWSFV